MGALPGPFKFSALFVDEIPPHSNEENHLNAWPLETHGYNVARVPIWSAARQSTIVQVALP